MTHASDIRTPLCEALSAHDLDRIFGEPHRGGIPLIRPIWGAGMPGLELGSIHEWFGENPAVALLSALARQRGGWAVWVGRACWAHPRWVVAERSVFVDPRSEPERVWAIDQALRCAGVSCVIADGSGIDMPASRRLQLAAKAGGTLGLLARPLDDVGTLSAARTRWRATPAPNPDARFYPEPRWSVELLRCKGLWPETEARHWTVQANHDTGDVVVVPDAGDRGVETTHPRRFA